MIAASLISTPEPTTAFLHLHHSKPNPSPIFSNTQFGKSRISGGNLPSIRLGVRAFYAVETRETLYEVLGIPATGSSTSDIKKAYKELARKYHPDVSPPERVDENTRRFILVHEAYETLSNPQSRALYDGDLAGNIHRNNRVRSYETEDWKIRWESQLDELQRRGSTRAGKTSWAARMRAQNSSKSTQ